MTVARPIRFAALAVLALIVIGLSVAMLERGRAGLQTTQTQIGTTPATLYQLPDRSGPIVVIAHGFAGSRQLMLAYSLSLARAGYRVIAFDSEGHGRNPVPMSGDVTRIDGTTARLVAETRRVIAHARTLPGAADGIAVLGHSMATDIVVRAAIAEDQAGTPIGDVVAISMFSQAVTQTAPARLLVISGEWERQLRAAALAALRLVKPTATEGETVAAPGVVRRAIVAPAVEHVGVLFSGTAVRAARDWLDSGFGRSSVAPIVRPGVWILTLLAGIVTLFRTLVPWLPPAAVAEVPVGTGRFLAAILLPSVFVPLVATPLYSRFLPVLVADYLLIHLALFGVIQLVILRPWRHPLPHLSVWPIAALLVWGIAAFGLALDRYAASFWPTPERLGIIVALALGTVPFMVADGFVTGGGQAALWRRLAARFAMLASIGAAAMLDPDRLIFLVIILPVIVLFFLIYGLMGRWVARQCGTLAAGLGLGLILAWTLGVSFPLFADG